MTLKVVNPYSGEEICELAYDRGAHLEHRVARAVAAQHEWRNVSVAERVHRVAQGLADFRAAADDIATDVTRQVGKPLAEARREVEVAIARAEHMMAIAEESLAADQLPTRAGITRRIEHEPLGVVLNLAAWNYPLLIAVNVVVPALLAGNSVLLKHSTKTPLTGEAFERAFAGLEPWGLVANLVLDHEQTAELIADARIDHVAFTGSVDGGRAVYRSVSERLIDAGLELGGKDPAYVAADADLDSTVAGIVDGACYNAGQSCCAVERVYVHASRYDEFLERATSAIAGYVLGDPTADDTTMGPMVSRGAVQHVADQVEGAVAAGARCLAGGAVDDERFHPPTLLADCPQDCDAMQEETFGPLIPVHAVRDDDEALSLMNDSCFGLTASVWTQDRARAEFFAREVAAGTVYQNRCDYLDPAQPWTGYKDSGVGSTLSRYGFWHLTRRKSIHLRG